MPVLLIVSASPLDQDRLRLAAEFRDIKKALQRSKNRENWTIESNEAATVDDLRLAMLDYRPAIVHFAGHGGGADGLCFEDDSGNTNLSGGKALSNLFHHFKDDLKCVVLNACYSEDQGHVICEEIDYVVGMNAAVGDVSASKFAVAFYDAVFAGTGFRSAFDLGCTALDLNNLPDSDVPVFLTGTNGIGDEFKYAAVIPEIERVIYDYINTPFEMRAKFTTGGVSIQPAMSRFYSSFIHKKTTDVCVEGYKKISENRWIIKTTTNQKVYVFVRERSVLIDWEATVGLWSVPARTFITLGSDEPVVARVIANLADYYNYSFRGQKMHFQSVELMSLSGEAVHGYVERDTPEFDDLVDILCDGERHYITLELLQDSDQRDMAVIKNVLSDTWFVGD